MARPFNEIEPNNRNMQDFDKFIYLNRSRINYYKLFDNQNHKDHLISMIKSRKRSRYGHKTININEDGVLNTFYQQELLYFINDFENKVEVLNHEDAFIDKLISRRKDCIDEITKRREILLEMFKSSDAWISFVSLNEKEIITFIGWVVEEEGGSIPEDQYIIMKENMMLVFEKQRGSYLSEYYGFEKSDGRPRFRTTIIYLKNGLKPFSDVFRSCRVDYGKSPDAFEIYLESVEQVEGLRNHFDNINTRDSSLKDWNIEREENRVKFVFVEAVNTEVDRLEVSNFQYQVEQEDVSDDLTIIDQPKDKPSKTSSGYLTSYDRDSRISKKAIVSAKYKCEIDASHVYFISKVTGENYVEAHHLIPMEFQDKGGFAKSIDVEANIVSLCVSCHKKIHHATYEMIEPLIVKLYDDRIDRLKDCDIWVSKVNLLSYYK